METVISLDFFNDIRARLRQSIPTHDEFPERITEEEARSFLDRIPMPGSHDFIRFETELTFSGLAVLCRMLCLPEADAGRDRWEPIVTRRSGKTLYLQLRSMLQFHHDNTLLRDVFVTVAAELRKNPSGLSRIRSLLKAEQDDFSTLGHDESPVDFLLGKLLQSKAPMGVYALDQGLIRHSPLFNRLRERFFMICPVDGFQLNSRDMLLCMDVETEMPDDVHLQILSHYLDVHTVRTFPHDLTKQLVERFGSPDDSVVWKQAETLRTASVNGSNPGTAGEKKKSAPLRTDSSGGLYGLAYWLRFETMKEHFGEKSLKMEVFTRYMPQLEKVAVDPAHDAILLYYANMTVIDFSSVFHFSWVCDPVELESRYDSMIKAMLDQGDHEPGLRKRRKIPEARDFIIEQENGAAIRLTFAEVGKLYAYDLLSIRLGLMEREIWGVM